MLLSLVLAAAAAGVVLHAVLVLGERLEAKDLWNPVVKMVPYLSHEIIASMLLSAALLAPWRRTRAAALTILAYLLVLLLAAWRAGLLHKIW